MAIWHYFWYESGRFGFDSLQIFERISLKIEHEEGGTLCRYLVTTAASSAARTTPSAARQIISKVPLVQQM
jgi:hypothetical protein